MVNITTIQISEKTKNELDSLKDYPRETYEDVIEKLLDIVAEDNMELSEETKRDIEDARKQIKTGKFVTEQEMKRRLDLK